MFLPTERLSGADPKKHGHPETKRMVRIQADAFLIPCGSKLAWKKQSHLRFNLRDENNVGERCIEC